MRVLGCTLLTFAIVIVVGCGRSNNASKPDGDKASSTPEKEKTNAEKIVGVWVFVKGSKELPPETTAEFTGDHKLKMRMKVKGEEKEVAEGTYKVEGDKLKVTMKGPDGKEHTDTDSIQTLTETTLITKDSKGNQEEYKKKK
jgi:uncharacterized protein (TIGR03066 family)